jgi:hypothetical protein
MNPSQVFVFSEETPFGQDLAGLLHPQGELGALGWETDLNEAIRRIRKIHPPAVIVAGRTTDTDCGPAVTRLQAECPGLQIAEVNLENRTVRMCGGETQIVQELKELLETVERLGSQSRDKSRESQPSMSQYGGERNNDV